MHARYRIQNASANAKFLFKMQIQYANLRYNALCKAICKCIMQMGDTNAICKIQMQYANAICNMQYAICNMQYAICNM